MENNVRFELNLNQVNVVLGALGKLPLEQSVDTFMSIRQQVEAQVQPQQSFSTTTSPEFEVTE
jgi:hypothetical protein